VRRETVAGAGDRVRRFHDPVGRHAGFRSGELRRELRVLLFERVQERLEGLRPFRVHDAQRVLPVHPGLDERPVEEILVQQDAHDRQEERPLGSRIRRQPEVRLRRRVREPGIDGDQRRPLRLRVDDPLRVRIEVMARLQVRRQQQDGARVRVVRRRSVRAGPEEVSEPSRRRADVGVAVVAVDPPCLQDAVRVAVFARPADVVHQLVPPVLLDRLADPRADVVQRLVPRDARPSALAAFAGALQRIENAIGIVELVRGDDPFRAGAAAAPGMHRIAFDLADVQLLLVDVGEDAARGLAVEADRRNDPVVAALLPRPARGLVVGVVVPLGWIRMGAETGRHS